MASLSDRARRMGVSGIVLAGLLALRGAPLPGLDPEVLAWKNEVAPGGMPLDLSMAMLGVTPWLTAFVLVELGALLRQTWRVRRVGSPQDRAPLWTATRWLWLAVCMTQAFGVAIGLEQVVADGLPLVQSPGTAFRLVTVLTLTAGSALFALGAKTIDRWGFGRGFAVLAWLQAAEASFKALNGQATNNSTLLLALLPVLAAWQLLPRRRSPGIPLLSAGVWPSMVAGSALALVVNAGLVSEHNTAPSAAFAVGVTAVMTILLSTLLHLPRATASVLGCTEGEARRGLLSTWPGAVLACTLLTLAELAPGSDDAVWSPILAVMLFGYIWDLADEWRDRATITDPVVVWHFQRVFEVGPAIEALESEGVTARVRGLHIREIAHFFAPHVPIEVLVPRESEAKATRLLQRRLHERSAGSEAPRVT